MNLHIGAIVLAAGLTFIIAPLTTVMGIVVLQDEPESELPTGAHIIEGVVTNPNQAKGPFAKPFVFGHVGVSVNYGYSPHTESHSYVKESRGQERVVLRTTKGKRTVVLTEPMRTFRDFKADTRRLRSIKKIPGAKPSWPTFANTTGYTTYVLAVRSGDRIMAELTPTNTASRVWYGGRKAAEQRRKEREALNLPFAIGSGVAALLALVFGGSLGVWGFRGIRQQRRAGSPSAP